MNVLLLSMPDSFEHMPPVAIRIPNGALASLAGNVDPHHRVAIADLILVQSSVRADRRAAGADVAAGRRRSVGDDVSACDGAEDCRAHPDASAIGPGRRRRLRSEPRPRRLRGVRPSTSSSRVKGSGPVRTPAGDRTWTRAARASPGLSYRTPTGWVRNTARPVDSARVRRPAAAEPSARVLGGYTLLGRQVDVVETSRGCTFDCSFCSIIEMRGRNFHPYPIDACPRRHRRCASRTAPSAIFLVDDNITLDVHRFEALCRGDRRSRLRRRRLHRPGDDLAARRSTAPRWRR